MKKIKNTLFLLIAICALLTPNFVFAAPTQSEGSETNTSENQTGEKTETTVEKEEEETGKEEETKPTPSPEASAKEDTEAILSDLEISEGKWNKTFSPAGFDYTITVNSSVSGIIITPEVFGNATVTGDTGTKSLEMGTNTFTITVTSKKENNTNTYTLKVIRATDNLTLKSLKIRGQNLNEVFAASTYDYTADITYNVESITVQAAADDENATVTVSGSSNLKVGKNTVKIIVKNQAGESEEYRIIVTRGAEGELITPEEDIDDESNQVTSSEIITSVPTSTPDDTTTTPTEKSDDTLKYVLIIVFCVILLIVAGLGIYFYIVTGDSEKRRQKKIAKLKKKQEKINQELTGLLPIITEEYEEEYEEESTEEEETEDPIELENTIEIEPSIDEELTENDFEDPKPRKRVDRNVLEDFEDLFLDE